MGGEVNLGWDLLGLFEGDGPVGSGGIQERSPLLEWTMGVNFLQSPGREGGAAGTDPRALTGAVLNAWVAAGVNRMALSFGSDGLNREEPVHPWVREACTRIRDAGLEQISVEVEIGGGAPKALADVLEAWIGLGIPQLALFEPEGVLGSVASEIPAWIWVDRHLRDRGYRTADGVHYFRPEQGEPLHPRAIRRREPILGLGPGAVTFRNPVRRANVGGEEDHCARLRAGLDPLLWQERLAPGEVRTERIWWGLRSGRGLPDRLLGPRARGTVEAWRRKGWAEVRGGRWILRPEGWVQADGLAVDLLLADEWDRR
jgi:hypothetical protein